MPVRAVAATAAARHRRAGIELAAAGDNDAPTPAAMSDLPLPMPPAAAFFGLDLQALAPPQRDALRHADADFRAVAAGRVPLHARIDPEAPLPADCGTRYYRGQGYRLTVLRRLSSIGAQTAIAYGPILQLDEALFAAAALPAISDVRLYTPAALGQLSGAAAQA
ncbi:hypothetical protein [Xanthomonas bonasiae]|uniref:hypothetical protein n=1 Tax=Xanthomonas bonasiae TaxID=2810351 RepID=UPI0017876BF5|nr:hypothetical protein [Xanthomonas surreyensis]MBD7924296.1 hypothetical protein [Xanthomonas surreyensis]